MLDNLRIAEAYESMYSAVRSPICESRVDEGGKVGFLKNVVIPGVAKGVEAGGKYVGKAAKTVTGLFKSKGAAKAGTNAVKAGTAAAKGVSSSAKTTQRLSKIIAREEKELAKLSKGSAEYAAKMKRISKLKRLKYASKARTAKRVATSPIRAAKNGVRRVGGSIARFGAKHPLLMYMTVDALWPAIKKLSSGARWLFMKACKAASYVIDPEKGIITGFDTKRMTYFLGESEESVFSEFTEYVKTKLSQSEKDVFLEVFKEVCREKGEDVDLDELTDEDKDAIVGTIIRNCIHGIGKGDSDEAREKKILMNLEGVKFEVPKADDGSNEGAKDKNDDAGEDDADVADDKGDADDDEIGSQGEGGEETKVDDRLDSLKDDGADDDVVDDADANDKEKKTKEDKKSVDGLIDAETTVPYFISRPLGITDGAAAELGNAAFDTHKKEYQDGDVKKYDPLLSHGNYSR